MRIISKDNLCENRPYINLKKLTWKTSLRVDSPDNEGFKSTYIIDQHKESLCKNDNYTSEYNDGIIKLNFNTEDLNKMLLVEVNYSSKSGDKSAKFKVYIVLDNVKYALPFDYFEDIYKNCMTILEKEVKSSKEINYIKAGFNNLKKEERTIDINLNLKRLSEFKDKVNYKRNVDYFVINNVTSSTSKYDINTNTKNIIASDTLKVLRYNYHERLYYILDTKDKISLQETDIICDLSENDFATVSIYTSYGLGKLLDVKNNVIPNTNLISLFANILDLGLQVLN